MADHAPVLSTKLQTDSSQKITNLEVVRLLIQHSEHNNTQIYDWLVGLKSNNF
jgi:hypothetical protein